MIKYLELKWIKEVLNSEWNDKKKISAIKEIIYSMDNEIK